MKKKILILSFFLCLICTELAAQTATLKGRITDATTGEALIQATVRAGSAATVSDFDGFYVLEKLPAGETEVLFSYIGYADQKLKAQLSDNAQTLLDVRLNEDAKVLQEISVVADVARSRQTPVAFTTISLEKIKTELSTQDLPMVLNSTPGVYATQQGGGAGDARINIRGFNQRNIAIMIDGVPVNDMENGWVYWSNWSGLNEVARSLQVQRGLGASKLALPSIGGTINILTKGIEAKRRFSVEQTYGANSAMKTTLSATSGRLKGGWGVTFTGSYSQTDGWADQTWAKIWFYFFKVEKELGKHLIGFSATGGPQQHGQRTFKQRIARYDIDYALGLGVDTSQLSNFQQWDLGLRYNSHWGYLDKWAIEGGDTISNGRKPFNESVNYYHKPQITLKDFWTINDKFSLSTIAYLSLGRGGGRQRAGSSYPLDENDLVDFQTVYNTNSNPPGWDGTSERNATKIIRSAVNSHTWGGLLSTFDYQANKNWTVTGGIDLRSYRGMHYREVYDLLGGDYYDDKTEGTNLPGLPNPGRDLADPANTHKYVGDKIDRHYDGLVKWGGVFGQVEYSKNKVAAFLNLTGAANHYQRIDYFQARDLVLPDTTILKAVAYTRPYVHEGDTFRIDAPELRYSEAGALLMPGFTVKTGMNYNINDHHNVFFNTGYLYKAPPFENVYSNLNEKYDRTVHERIAAAEVGYGAKYRKFALNVNTYYTAWLNKPLETSITNAEEETVQVNVAGLKAHHRGIELDFAYDIIPQKLKIEGLASYGDWVWKTDSTAVLEANGDIADALNGNNALKFSANGVHVGDAAQMQFAGSIQVNPIKNSYVRVKWTYFGKNYAEFSPEQLTGVNADRDSWQLPDYQQLELHLGYRFKFGGLNCKASGSILNLLDTKYVSDASTRSGFDIDDIEVFFGQGRRWSASLEVAF